MFEELADVVLDLFLLVPKHFLFALSSVLFLVVLDHKGLVLHLGYSKLGEALLISLYVVQKRAVFDFEEDGVLIKEGGLFEAQEEEGFVLFVELLGDECGELIPEGLEGLLKLDLLDGAVFLVVSQGQVLSQLPLNVLKQRNEGFHGRSLLHGSLLRLVPHHQRKPLLRVSKAALLHPDILDLDGRRDLKVLAGIVEIGELDDELDECLSV